MQYNITYRKKNNSWQYIISYKDGLKWKQRSKQGFELSRKGKELCKDAAEKEAKDLQDELVLEIPKEYQELTFKEYTKIFIEHQKLYKEPNTIVHYKAAFAAFNMLDDLQMNKIGNIDIQKCVDELIKTSHNSTTIEDYLSSLHYTFNYALKKSKIIAENPVQNIEIKTEKAKKVKVALTKSELSDLLKKIKNNKLRLMSMIAAKCGLRISEIMGLTWNDIDLKNCMMKINKQWKKDEDGIYKFGSLKSKNSNREVPIPPDLIQELKNYKSAQKIININDRVFNYKSREHMSSTFCSTYRKAGYKISIHELRHTYGTMLIANGLDFKTVAKLMGDDVKQTLDTYSHVNDDMMNNAKDIINRAL